MNSDVDSKTLIVNVKSSLSVKEVIGKGSFLIYLGIAIAGYYPLRAQVAATASDFKQLETTSINYTKAGESVVQEPTFYLIDSKGTTIDTKNGIKADAFYPMKVLAGSSFRVREIEIIVSRGSSRVVSMFATNDTPDTLNAILAPGDRVIIIIKRVLKTTPNGDREVGFKNGTITIQVL